MKSILPLTPSITLINDNRVLNKRNGTITSIKDVSIQTQIRDYFSNNYKIITKLPDNFEGVSGLDNVKINFFYKTSDGVMTDFKNGFLIEVYESGSDGKLTRLVSQDIQDPLDENNAVNDSFSQYFTLELDVVG